MPKTKQLQGGNSAAKRSPAKVRSGIASRIRPLSMEDRGIHMSIYGRSGTGKTTFWATFPKPILVLLCSGKGELLSVDTAANRKGIQLLELETSSDVFEACSYQQTGNEFKTIVLDHATGLQDLVLMEVLGLKEIPVQLTWGMATQSQYGQVGIQMKTYLRRLLDLACNVVIVAQERAFNTEGEGSDALDPYVSSALTPSVVGWLNPACDYICQTYIRRKTGKREVSVAGKTVVQEVDTGDVEYCLRTAPSPVYHSKFRLPRGTSDLPDAIVDPTYAKVIKLIKGGT